MESPPSSSSWSHPLILSDDSGLLLTTGSLSSANTSFESKKHFIEDSDCEEKSLSQDDDSSEGVCNFNTLKKGPHNVVSPPIEFQDRPIDDYCDNITKQILKGVMWDYRIRTRLDNPISPPPLPSRSLNLKHPPIRPLPERHTPRPSSRSSLGSSRLSSSHNSLCVTSVHRDDSTFITQAVSHDTLSTNQISDLYNVPFDSDIYALPVDVVKPKNKKSRRRKERHSVAETTATSCEPIHMSLQEVRTYLHTLYAGKDKPTRSAKRSFLINLKTKKVKDSCEDGAARIMSPVKRRKRRVFSFKQVLCNLFKFRKFLSMEEKVEKSEAVKTTKSLEDLKITDRALPPLPNNDTIQEPMFDFPTSIQRVKDYGWYWGPTSSEAAEKILSNEPDGSFIVRDSSDDHYIFSLTFKVNNSVRHVRIEHFQGNFSFGTCTKFKSQTIVDFIENAVEHSRSGRYLFFLHRRPVIGPERVQLLHPISRFKQVQSLQHMCRFIIHKNVRRDLLAQLPLPRRMIDYLNTPHYYAES